jgi:hypothetical protein
MNDYPLPHDEQQLQSDEATQRHPGHTAVRVGGIAVVLVELLAACGGTSANAPAEPMVSTPAHPCVSATVQPGDQGIIQTINHSLTDSKGANLPSTDGYDGVRNAATTIQKRVEAANKDHVVEPSTVITYCYFPESKHVVDPMQPE